MSAINFSASRFQDDLRGLIEGDVLCDEATQRLYASDASHFEYRPFAVVFPRSSQDIASTVHYAAEHGLPVHPRGAGTGRTGGCLGNGVVLDMTRYMRRILRTDEESVCLQSGAIFERANRILNRSEGRIIGPNPGFGPMSSLGSILATNGAGSQWLKYGFPHQAVQKLQVVLATGEIITLHNPGSLPNQYKTTNPLETTNSHETAYREMIAGFDPELLKLQSATRPDRTGYRINEGLIPLFTGSEGTLGIITEAEIRTVPTPKSFGMVMFLFSGLDKAMRAVPMILAHQPNCCELIDRRRLSLLREWDKRSQSLVPSETEAILLVEIDGSDGLQVGDRLQNLINEIRHREQLCSTTRVAFHSQEIFLFRELLNESKMALARMPHFFYGLSLLEDVAVPVQQLPSYLVAIQNLFKRHELTPSFFGHVGHGQINVQPVLDLSESDVLSRMDRLIPEFYEELFQHQGTISSEQACGVTKTPWINKQCPKLAAVFETIKNHFDPGHLLNPGKVVPRENAVSFYYRKPLFAPCPVPSQQEPTPSEKQMQLQLKWDSQPIQETVLRCNGCGRCRSRNAALRMCPVFRHHFNEEATPRAKANLLRGIIDETMSLEILTTNVSKRVADHCLHCHLCRSECPAEVDVPRLAFRSKSAFAAAHNFSLSDWFFSHVDQILPVVAPINYVINWSLKNRLTRWIYEKAFGIPQERKMPKLARISFLSRTTWYKRHSRPSRRHEKRIAFFVDTFVNHFDPKLADAAIKVLEYNGVDVYVPGRQLASGVCAVTCGHQDRLEKLARHNVAILADVIRQGYEIVTLEPTSALTIRDEYRYVLDDPEATLVASETTDLCEYLFRLHTIGKLQLNFTPIHATVGYHAPCRSLAMNPGPLNNATAAESLLRLIPGLGVKRLERGCCGLSWDYGLKKNNFRMSLRIGHSLFSALRDPLIQIGSTECNACKMQMEHGVSKNTIHPIKLLAYAYRLMPEIAPLLLHPKKTETSGH